MKTGLLHDYFKNFSMWGEKYYFYMEGRIWGEIEPMWGEIELNIGKLENLKKLKFPFWVEGTFGDDIWWERGWGRTAGVLDGGAARDQIGGIEQLVAIWGQQRQDRVGQDGGVGHWGGLPDRRWSSRHGMEFQSGVGFQTRDGVPYKGWVPDRWWDSRHQMMGFRTGDDGVTTLTSHQSRILYSLIFFFTLKDWQGLRTCLNPAGLTRSE